MLLVCVCVCVTKKYVYSHKTHSDIIMKNVSFLFQVILCRFRVQLF